MIAQRELWQTDDMIHACANCLTDSDNHVTCAKCGCVFCVSCGVSHASIGCDGQGLEMRDYQQKTVEGILEDLAK